MITKGCTGLLLLNLIFISSVFSKSLESKASSSTTTTTRRPTSSSPSSTYSPVEISDQITKWSGLVSKLKVHKEDGEDIVRLSPLLKLTYKIHKFEGENKQILENDKNLKKKFSALKSNIPEGLSSLVWGSKCAIRNAQESDAYLKLIQPSGKGQALKFELGNGTKTYWKFLPFLENLSGNEEKLAFFIQSFDNSDNFLGIKSVSEPIAGGWADNGGVLEIIKAGQNGPGKMIKWTLDPIISAGGPSKGLVVSWMSVEDPHPKEPSTLYLHGSLKAASIFRVVDGSVWAFECAA